MQYILSENELQAYRNIRLELETLKKKLPSIEVLQEICTKAANEWATYKRYDGTLEPWHCVITSHENHEEHYCDKCPVQKICPYPHKEWSK